MDAIRRADGIDWVHVLNGGVGRMLEMARANARTIPGALSTGRR